MTFYLPAGDGAVLRDIDDKLRESVSVLDFGALGDGETDDSAAFALALAYVESLPRGGEIYLPAGVYVMDMDLTKTTADFEKRVRIRGAGRGATQVWPTGDQAIILNLLGRNVTTVQDLTLYAGDVWQAACAVYAAREDGSPNCNNNKFVNVEIAGNFSAHAVVWCGAESSLWFNCRIAPNNGTHGGDGGTAGTPDSGFWIGSDPSLCDVDPPAGTPIAGGCTDNRMIACETYIPYPGARHITLSRSVGWLFLGHSFIGGSRDDQRFVTYCDPDSNVFNGPARFRDCHYEVFGTGNVAHFIDNPANATSYWLGIGSEGGFCNTTDGLVFADFNRNALAGGGPFLIGSTFSAPVLPGGITSGLPLYLFNIGDSRIDWRMRDENGLVVVLGFAVRTPIDANSSRIQELVQCDAPLYSDAVPTSGTFARSQTLQRIYTGAVGLGESANWLVSFSGSFGTLNGGATTASGTSGNNHVTVNSATGLAVGQLIQITDDGGPRRVAAIVGSTIYFTSNLSTSPSGKATAYYPGGAATGYFVPVGFTGIQQCAAQSNSTATDVAGLKTDFNALLAKLRTSNLLDT